MADVSWEGAPRGAQGANMTYTKVMTIRSLRVPRIRALSRSAEAVAWKEALEQGAEPSLPSVSKRTGQLLMGHAVVGALYALYGEKHELTVQVIDEPVPAGKPDPGLISRRMARAKPGAPITKRLPLSGRRADIETFGLSTDETWDAQVGVVDLHLHRAALSVSKAIAEVKQCIQTSYPQPDLEPLLQQLRDVREAIDNTQPKSLCPDCKGLPIKGCELCDDARWVGDVEDVPDVLLDHETLVVRDPKADELVAYDAMRRRYA